MDRVIVTDFEKVELDNFYLSEEWEENKGRRTELRKMAKEGNLFIAYEVGAADYLTYRQMDARQLFINEDGDIMLSCESAVIGNEHEEVFRGETF